MDKVIARLGEIGLVPVVKIENADDAVPLARALVKGGLPCAEITFRTSAGAEAIRRIADDVPEMLVGAGTVLTAEQADEAASVGASFIVSPGFNADVVDHCIERGLVVMPGVNSPTGVEQCLARGLEIVKFFPAEASGGIKMIDALAGPYADVEFMPTGGIGQDNLTDYTTNPHVLACGGTWMVKEALIAEGRFDEVERLAREAVRAMLGFELAHIGVNAKDEGEAQSAAKLFCDLFDFEYREGASIFCDSSIEVLKAPYLGKNGHIAISTIDIDRAVAHFDRRGIALNQDSAKYLDDGRLNAIYLEQEVAGFAVHLVRR